MTRSSKSFTPVVILAAFVPTIRTESADSTTSCLEAMGSISGCCNRLGYKVGQEITFGELKKRAVEAYGTELPEMCDLECGLSSILECAEGLRKLSAQ